MPFWGLQSPRAHRLAPARVRPDLHSGRGPAGTKGWLESRYSIRTEDTGAFLERLALHPSGSPYAPVLRTVKGVIKRWR